MAIKAVILDYHGLMEPFYGIFEPVELETIITDDKPDAVFVWNDVLEIFQNVCLVANRYGVPTFMIQHGRRAISDYLPGAEPQAKPLANVVFVWGEDDKKMAIESGWKPENVFRVGAPWFRFLQKKEPIKGRVVFDALHWDKEVQENYTLWNELKKIDGIKPVAKLLEGHHNVKKFFGDVMTTNIDDPHAIEATIKLISTAECLVTVIEDTMTSLAYAMDIPVVFVKDLFPPQALLGRKLDPSQFGPSEAAHVCTLDTLEETIKHAVEHPDEKRNERKSVTLKESGDPEKDAFISSISAITNTICSEYAKQKV